MTITSDSVVTLHYTVSTEDGTTLDSSEGKSPLVVLLGRRFLIEGLEDALIGKSKEDSFNVSVNPEKAYGERSDELVQTVPRSMFDGMDVEVGMSFRATTPQGEQSVIIIETTDEEVVVDGNHPLAGIPLTFDVTVVDVREATKEELEHGHAHGAGGCGHDH
ncbi:FKBP-type peptidyl prolyl cis-trans isomerase [Alteromonas macleodii str. 'Black Sea 11']|jgi:FKBP-type peptidyl-prolyl cis-trans isomerase SlyD|uniref:FKBP-type peptidyl-prolyl cis-trans isomerase n=1 Tax=Alteromonas abrolhosensis TaxID=1892904 RepID=UPI000286E062|nr:peptidylprolyl isomerase [Alteromonas abrolhosensis]AFT79088.1 FKBP-type peptidyl prolyl cis-trans isomerase [Alteromonas macleodii str. 'Black Sea 11']NKW88844.1 peptidylprolyl isomerase [Alteromonadaceae bacterium A_SAG4]NKX18308.1 peptidylprolyl isomerase [Alteromonadaceae bacterium A_SAG5]NKX34860.1 peptidylprolyl isomerase [Alteromonadaceae bacterium A_SAG3]NKX68829.1 peptidylprolyl isomerase [Alteromonadaceae bacterium A_SAG7]